MVAASPCLLQPIRLPGSQRCLVIALATQLGNQGLETLVLDTQGFGHQQGGSHGIDRLGIIVLLLETTLPKQSEDIVQRSIVVVQRFYARSSDDGPKCLEGLQ